jgi:microcystin-dependent protein
MSNPFIGEIRMFAGNFAPRSFAFCDGQLLTVAQQAAVFALLGTNFGGDGLNTFGLPDMRGRIPISQGTLIGVNTYVIGQAGGQETVTLTTAQLPSHSHDLIAAAGGTKQASPSGAAWASGGPAHFASNRVTPTTGQLQGGGLTANVGGQPHNNMMPYLAVNFIICLEGVFPSRN